MFTELYATHKGICQALKSSLDDYPKLLRDLHEGLMNVCNTYVKATAPKANHAIDAPGPSAGDSKSDNETSHHESRTLTSVRPTYAQAVQAHTAARSNPHTSSEGTSRGNTNLLRIQLI